MRFSRKELVIYVSAFCLLFFSGIVWLILHYFCNVDGEFGLMSHPLESKILALHGIMGLSCTFIFGSIFATHVKQGMKYKSKKNRKSGIINVTILVTLCLSGAGLYYIGSDSVRLGTSFLHWGCGILLFFVMVIHIAWNKK